MREIAAAVAGMGDGPRPQCQVALCKRPANYLTLARDGTPVYCCTGHRPFARLMTPPPPGGPSRLP